MATELGRVFAYHKGLPPKKSQNHLITWQTKKTYLHYHSEYSHQTWQDDDLPWEGPTWRFDRVVLEDQVTN